MCKPRIFYYDNRQVDLDRLRDTFRRTDFELETFLVNCAEDRERLRERLRNEWWHLVIGDICLGDVEDKDVDEFGLEILMDIDPVIPRIAWTAYPNYDRVRKALQLSDEGIRARILDLIHKASPGSGHQLIKAITAAFKTKEFLIDFNLEIERDENIFFIALPKKFGVTMQGESSQTREIHIEEIEDLFRKLFAGRKAIKIEQLPIERNRYAFFQVQPSSETGDQSPLVVMVGPRVQVLDLRKRWGEYVEPYLHHQKGQYARKAETLHYAALAFQLDDRVSTFEPLFSICKGPAEKVISTLEQLFQVVCELWIKSDPKDLHVPLGQLFLEDLELTGQQEKLDTILKRNLQNMALTTPLVSRLGTTAYRLYWNPGKFIEISNPGSSAYNQACLYQDLPGCCVRITHGDLNLDTIRVNPKGEFWILPSEKMGEGFYLRDLISLEADVIFRTMAEETPENLLLGLRAWLSPSVSSEAIPYQEAPENCRKPLMIADAFRKLAAKFGADDLQLYYGGLLIHAAARITSAGRSGETILILAYLLISDRLSNWEHWAPGIMPATESLQLDADQSKVYIPWLQKWKKLGETDFNVIKILSKSPKQLIPFKNLHEAWGSGVRVTPDMLNQSLARLRKIMKPVSGDLEYIGRQRGKGVIFYPDGKSKTDPLN
jgi:hypothetical protein